MKKLFFIISICLAMFAISGCSTKMGAIGDKSHFTYPNSNVEPLGNVSVQISKTGIIFPKSFEKEDVREMFSKALSQKAGADLLINYKLDTKFTSWVILPVYTTTMTIEGTAAKMTVGKKELLELKSAY
jgi:hypothetical protein